MQMTGVWHVYRAGERWRRPAHRARVVIEVDDGTAAVCFDAPTVDLRRDRGPDHLGPDLCTSDADLNAVLANLAAVGPTSEIGALLLNQRVAAGIGNVYKSEVCWAARVNPFTPVRALDDAQRRELYELAQKFLIANVDRARRVTFGNGVAVYNRAGRPCPRCRTLVRARKQGDPPRTTYWCPTCQPA
jgi:endonuclease-8